MGRPITPDLRRSPPDPRAGLGNPLRMYQRTLAAWAEDLLRGAAKIHWPKADPEADYRDHNWKQLYNDSVLDD